MSNRYGGESVGKKLARYSFWDRTKRWLGDRFFTEQHLVLASRDGGDVAVLKGLGVTPQNIVAVDTDKEAVDECRRKHPGVIILHDDVVQVARRSGRVFASAFLDFCSWPTENAIDAAWQATAFGLKDGAVLGYAFQRGREPAAVFSEISDARAVERRQQTTELARMAAAGVSVPRGARLSSTDGRGNYIYERLQDQLDAQRIAAFTLARINYHSSCAWRRGVPMTIWAKWIRREPRFISPKKFKSRCQTIFGEWREAIRIAHDMALQRGAAVHEYADALPGELREEYEIRYLGHAAVLPVESTFDREFLTMHNLVAASRHLDEMFPGEAHRLLNVAPGRLAAWRAHATRGTYATTGSRRLR